MIKNFRNAKILNNTAKRFMSGKISNSNVVLREKKGNIFLIGINRPEKRNCVNQETSRLLTEAVKEFEKDDSTKIAVLHGIGGNFCAGYDLGELSKAGQDDSNLQFVPEPPEGPMGPTRMLISKPIIAAVSGYAVAGGLELALMCDMRVMEETAVMGVFCRRFGVPLTDGGTVRLPRLIGLSRALDFILTGRPIKALEAFEIGLANRLVKHGTALTEAIKLAEQIEQFPQLCMNADRASAYYSTYTAKSLSDAFEFEHNNSLEAVVKESISGAKKFVDGVGLHGQFNIKNIKSNL